MDGLNDWNQNFKNSVDWDNCSSNSTIFYIMFLIGGTIEMFLSVCLFFDFKVIENTKTNIEPYKVNYWIFAFGLLIELIYWVAVRIYLAKSYIKYCGNRYSKLYRISVIATQTIVSIIPSDMLVFFGYSG